MLSGTAPVCRERAYMGAVPAAPSFLVSTCSECFVELNPSWILNSQPSDLLPGLHHAPSPSILICIYIYIYMGPYRLSLYIYWSICLHTMSWCWNPRLQPQPVSPHSPIAMCSLSPCSLTLPVDLWLHENHFSWSKIFTVLIKHQGNGKLVKSGELI